MKIIVDAMGGDNAPEAVVAGAVMAAEQFNIEIILTGRGEDILRCIQSMGKKELPRGIEIVNADEVITMDDDPVLAIREKKDSSMVVGLKMLKEGVGDAFVTAGSTGAALSGATLIVKRVRGVRRAALAPYLPSKSGGFIIIDCGANVECTPEYLLQFAFMGAYYAESVLMIKKPRVALLNNGVERSKGTALQLGTYELLERAHSEGYINFVGNIEAREAMQGACDVIVCDGFSGNIFLKAAEGVALFLMDEFKQVITKNIFTKLSMLFLKGGVKGLRSKFDADKIGGTALLGISRPVVKAHGSSNAKAICGAIRQAEITYNASISEKLAANIDRMRIDDFVEKEQ